jgi:hypothetical protein
MCACSNDNNNNTTSPDPISELKLDNLVFLNSNIPQDFYTDLTFTNENTGYAISRTGVILKTTDGGINWSSYNVTGNMYLKKVQFINANVGYIIGGDTSGSYILKTINAGQTWNIIDLHNPEAGYPSSMYFKNENEGYITGNKLFIKTIDGGQNWTNVLTAADEDFKDVNFKNNNFGIATVNTGDYYRTTNGGASWQSIELNRSYNLNEIYFVCGKTLIKSGNQLVDIESSSTITLPNPVHKLHYLNATKCIGIGQHYEIGFFPYGDILLTNNNWETFLQKTYQPSTETMDFTAIAKVNNHKTMMIGTGQLEAKIVTIAY